MNFFKIYTKDRVIKAPLIKETKTPEKKDKKELPYIINLAVALSTILTSLGLIFTVWQLKLSNEQFYTENKGVVNFKLTGNINIIAPDVKRNVMEYSAETLEMKGDIENIGHTPVEIVFEQFILEDNNGKLSSEENILNKIILNPAEKLPISFPKIHLCPNHNETHSVLFSALKERNLRGFFRIKYNNLHDKKRYSVIDRNYDVEFDNDNGISLTYTNFNDSNKSSNFSLFN
ncbi:hypothetical protein [Pedobacter sp. Leaf132]|uniref:hypothetical protein n=1 Tax=Pedobacter sp. Leaf132 TaxID=2876557 RepID=UPI001E325F8B|nr:hypothetical protein [Pedobacter sp. Leaf132]